MVGIISSLGTNFDPKNLNVKNVDITRNLNVAGNTNLSRTNLSRELNMYSSIDFKRIDPSFPNEPPSIIINGLYDDFNNIEEYRRLHAGIYIGSKVNDLNGDPYSVLIGTESDGGGNSYFNTSVGIYNDISGSINGTTIYGYNVKSTGGESVGIGRKVRVGPYSTIIGTQGNNGNSLTSGLYNSFYGGYAGYDISSGNRNICIGWQSGRNLREGNNNISIGYNSKFSGDVSNCLLINNQDNPNIGGIYGTGLGTDDFKLGLNTSSPTKMLDISSDTIRLRNRRIIATSTTDGSAGEICFDNSYAYFCVADNQWGRVDLSLNW